MRAHVGEGDGAPRLWNHNLHYHRIILEAVPSQATMALDIGCGEGLLAHDLRSRVAHVIAIDRDGPSIERARQRIRESGIEFITGDVFDHALPAGSFDLIACVAAIHHMEMERALRRMRDLLRPGGTLAIVGLARSRRFSDYLIDAAGAVVHRLHRLTKPYTEPTSPVVWPPPLTYGEVRRVAERVLPGVRYRRHALWRYSLVWKGPL